MPNTPITNDNTIEPNYHTALFKQSLKPSYVTGRRYKYTNVNKYIQLIDNYFNHCIEHEKKLTVTGLALYIGFNSRQSLYDYADKYKAETQINLDTKIPKGINERDKLDFILQKLAYTTKKALSIIESDYEQSLRKYGRSGDIFALKNFGWKDTQEVNNTGTVNHNVIMLNAEKKQSIEQWEQAEDQETLVVSDDNEPPGDAVVITDGKLSEE